MSGEAEGGKAGDLAWLRDWFSRQKTPANWRGVLTADERDMLDTAYLYDLAFGGDGVDKRWLLIVRLANLLDNRPLSPIEFLAVRFAEAVREVECE